MELFFFFLIGNLQSAVFNSSETVQFTQQIGEQRPKLFQPNDGVIFGPSPTPASPILFFHRRPRSLHGVVVVDGEN